ncbi:hypothetical protein TNCV_3836351 [Trichonephila clavipes]|nr:hypothetical protein TNCV_3836351 [Trichonephila clavipes]
MGFTEINSREKRGEFLGRTDRQNSRFRTAKTTRIKFSLHDSFVELESSKSALNEEVLAEAVQMEVTFSSISRKKDLESKSYALSPAYSYEVLQHISMYKPRIFGTFLKAH